MDITPSSFFASMDASSSGLAAERLRMEVIANNVANANTTKGPNGEPFRRQEVVFETDVNHPSGGVRVVDVRGDDAPFPKIYKPGHPHADAAGFVMMPNIAVSNEMVDLMVASRAYEANLNAIKTFQEMAESTLELLR